MKNTKLLYEIKLLEKLIIKNLSLDCSINQFQITPTQMQIMEYITENYNNEIYQKDLESILNLSRATVSGVLKTMEKNNLLKRSTNIEDARIKKIVLNDKAKKIFLENKNKMEKLENIVIDNIENEELEIFLKVIDIMKKNIINYYNK